MPETESLSTLISKIKGQAPQPKLGLPQELFYYVSETTPLINVDLLIKDAQGRTLLTWRDDQFYGPAWHIPGGIIRFKETMESRIHQVALRELQAQVRFHTTPVCVTELMNAERDVRGHFISLLFACELTSLPDASKAYLGQGDPIPEQWAWHDRAPEHLLSVHERFRGHINNPATHPIRP
jgi:ADP-ribose pyrophosphatase YjhB (NUDIX family)